MYVKKSLNRFKVFSLIFLGVLLILAFFPFLFWNTKFFPFYIEIISPAASLAAACLIVYTAYWSYKNNRDIFSSWLLLAMAMMLYSVANFVYFIFQDMLGVISYPSMADILYVAAYPLLIIGLLSFVKRPFKIRFKNLLDAVIIIISAFFIIWFPFIWPIVEPSQPDTISVIVSISYLFGDLLVLLTALTLLFNENRKIFELPLILFSLGMFFQIFGDMIYAYNALNPFLIYEWLCKVFYTTNSMLIILAVVSYLKNINIDMRHLIFAYRRTRAKSDWTSYLPLILVLFSYSLLIVTTPDEALIWGVGIIVVLVILREIFSLNEIRKAQENLKRNKELISKREEQLTFITSNMLDLIGETDENGIYKYISPSSNLLLGISPEELTGKSFYDLIHPDDFDKVKNRLKSVKPLESIRLQYRYKNAAGKYLWLETIVKPIFKGKQVTSNDRVKSDNNMVKNKMVKSDNNMVKNNIVKSDNNMVKNNIVKSGNNIIRGENKIIKGENEADGGFGGGIEGDSFVKGFIFSTRDISEQKEAEEFVKNSLKEKKTLLKEIHHRVNNNLQIISSLLNLQSKNVVDYKDHDLFVESQNRVRSMAMIHEKLYQSENLSSINFSDYLRTLLKHLMYDYLQDISQIVLDLDVDEDVELNIETSIPCGLIINELVSNSLKHAFPPGTKGKITVKMHLEDGKYFLVVGDDGVGGVNQTDLKNSKSLGLSLVNSLVNQIDGDIEILKGKGTFYKIVFQELEYRERYSVNQ